MSRSLWSMMCITTIGGLLVAGCTVRRASGQRREAPVSVRTYLEQRLGLRLPASAGNVKCKTEALFVGFLWARFDIPSNELPNVLSSGLLGKLPPLSNDHELYRDLDAYAGQPSWWKLPPEQNVQVSQSSWTEPRHSKRKLRSAHGPTVWGCTLSVCVAKADADSSRVYLLYVSDPGASVPE